MKNQTADTAPLDLSFLATGKSQHVFVKTGDLQDGYVYKVPAMFGYLLPFGHRDCGFRNSLWRISRVVLVWVPHGLFKRGFLPLLQIAQKRGWERAAHFLRAIEPVLRSASLYGQRYLAAVLRRARTREFARSLDCIEYLLAKGVTNVFLPCQVLRDQEVLLRFDGQCIRYRGPMLKQKRAETFFEAMGGLETFPWRVIIQAQYRLWQHGFGLSEPVETLGPYNWALLNGSIYLADTASVTDDVRKVRRCLRKQNLDQTINRYLPWSCHKYPLPRKDPPPLVLEYCAFIRRGINQDSLRKLWRVRQDDRDFTRTIHDDLSRHQHSKGLVTRSD